jgi:hypothetical protein
MNSKDLDIINIMSLHHDLMVATEINDMYCKQNDLHNSELWLNEMDAIIEEMKQMGGTN